VNEVEATSAGPLRSVAGACRWHSNGARALDPPSSGSDLPIRSQISRPRPIRSCATCPRRPPCQIDIGLINEVFHGPVETAGNPQHESSDPGNRASCLPTTRDRGSVYQVLPHSGDFLEAVTSNSTAKSLDGLARFVFKSLALWRSWSDSPDLALFHLDCG
jgi:hypothetical protein